MECDESIGISWAKLINAWYTYLCLVYDTGQTGL